MESWKHTKYSTKKQQNSLITKRLSCNLFLLNVHNQLLCSSVFQHFEYSTSLFFSLKKHNPTLQFTGFTNSDFISFSNSFSGVWLTIKTLHKLFRLTLLQCYCLLSCTSCTQKHWYHTWVTVSSKQCIVCSICCFLDAQKSLASDPRG